MIFLRIFGRNDNEKNWSVSSSFSIRKNESLKLNSKGPRSHSNAAVDIRMSPIIEKKTFNRCNEVKVVNRKIFWWNYYHLRLIKVDENFNIDTLNNTCLNNFKGDLAEHDHVFDITFKQSSLFYLAFLKNALILWMIDCKLQRIGREMVSWKLEKTE